MLSPLDILYIVLSFCAIGITIMLILIGMELLHAVRDLRQISANLEQITHLVQKIALIVFPGAELVAKGADAIERKVANIMKHASDKLGKFSKE